MIGDWSTHVRRECVGSDARFEFPVRPLGWAKLVGVLLVGFAVLLSWGPAHSVWEFGQKWRETGPNLGNVIFTVFPMLFVIVGCVLAAIGLLIVFGRCRVEWKNGRLRSTELLGLLPWSRRLPSGPIRKLEVSAATPQPVDAPRQPFDRFSALTAEFEDGAKKVVVLGYPKDWLLGLAEELRSYVGGGTPASPSGHVEVVDRTSQDKAVEDVLERPAGSLVQVEEHATGVRLTVPPAGVWRGSKGFFTFALFWCGFMTVFTVLTASSGFKADGNAWIPLPFVLVFWCLGLGMLAGAINMGRRTATFDVQGGRLCVETRGLFGAKRLEWGREEVSAIRADASGMEVNNRPVIELQIHPRTGKKVGVLAGREEDELRWMATRLRHALGVPARRAEPPGFAPSSPGLH